MSLPLPLQNINLNQTDDGSITPMKAFDLNKKSLFQSLPQQYKKGWTSPKQNNQTDRVTHSLIQFNQFIPSNVSTNLYNLFMQEALPIEIPQKQFSTQSNKEELNNNLYSNLLQSQILGTKLDENNMKVSTKISPQKKKKLLKFRTQKRKSSEIINLQKLTTNSLVQANFPDYDLASPIQSKLRKISKKPYKILEAPSLQDDYYLNLLDWSSFNTLGVGLDSSVFIWSGHTSKVQRLLTYEDPDQVCSIAWSQRNQHISVGNSLGEVEVWDIVKGKPIRKWSGHQGRIGSLAWNNYLLASGSRDRNILVRDVRQPEESIQRYYGHKQEICGLKWSYDEQLLSSGGNDNKLFIWSLRNEGELTHFSQHQAAVKAIGWSPHQHNIVASGGGTADRCIRFFNTNTCEQVNCIDTGSQVCNLMFSKNSQELVSTHGYSLNQIIVWSYPQMQKVTTLTGHTQRVLYLAGSPCGQNIVTGAGDESLRFWNVFAGQEDMGFGSTNQIEIR